MLYAAKAARVGGNGEFRKLLVSETNADVAVEFEVGSCRPGYLIEQSVPD
jgi:hypothetical protein